jgi:Zn-dependent protease/CBS domain-containing protein
MMRFRVGSAFDIPIRLDVTFLLVLPVFAYVIGVQLGEWAPLLANNLGSGIDAAQLTSSALVRYGIGSIAAVGLFACVVAHEFGHSLVARRYGVPIESITLWLLGGVAQMEEIPADWRKEFTIAIAGPIVSVAVGILSYVAFVLTPAGALRLEALRFTLAYLAVMNIVLAAFNLLPGFPMDGGRILRALLARSRPHARATQQAARVGQGFAILLGLWGLLAGFNPFLIVLALFIYIAAANESSRTVMNAAFERVSVQEVMTHREELHVVGPGTSVAELIERMFRERHTGYPVLANDRVAGIVTLSDAREVDEVEREAFPVEDVMTREMETATPETPVMDAFETMQAEGIGRLLVVDSSDSDRLIGLVSRTDVMTALEIVKEGGELSGRGSGRRTGRDAARDRGDTSSTGLR